MTDDITPKALVFKRSKVAALLGVCDRTLRRYELDPGFPQRIAIGIAGKGPPWGYLAAEINEYVANLPRAPRQVPVKEAKGAAGGVHHEVKAAEA
jgi:hypothetical protein